MPSEALLNMGNEQRAEARQNFFRPLSNLKLHSSRIKLVFLYFNRINILCRNLVYFNIDTAERSLPAGSPLLSTLK